MTDWVRISVWCGKSPAPSHMPFDTQPIPNLVDLA